MSITVRLTPQSRAKQTLLNALHNARQGHLQKTLAAKMGISAQYLCDMLNGRRDWTPEMIDKVVEALGRDRPWIDLADLHRLGAQAAGWRIPD